MSARISVVLAVGSLLAFGACGVTGSFQQQAGGNGFQRDVSPFPVLDSSGTAITYPFTGGFNAPRPQFVDIDGDNDPDLFIQERSDELIFFRHQDSVLEWQTDKYHNLDIGEWYRFADMDQDGDMDLLTERPYSYISYYRNDGDQGDARFTLVTDTLRNAAGEPIFSDRQNIPNVTDIDADSRLDLFIGRLDGRITRYESIGRDRRGIPQFELVTEHFEGIEIVKQFGSLHGANTLTFVDIDSDGDQDLFWGDFFEPGLLLIENRGSAGNPQLQGDPVPFPIANPMESSGYNAPTFADWDQDGRQDLLAGVLGGAYNARKTLSENLYFYRQSDGGQFRQQTNQFVNTIDIGNESIPAAGDIDGDGDLDLLLANKIDPAGGTTSRVYIFENRGSDGTPALYQNGILKLPDAYHYAPAMGDLNGDGLDDLLLGTWRGRIAYYRNSDSGFESVDQSFLEIDRGSNSTPVLADIDDDNDLDLFVGVSGGGVLFYRNEGSPLKPDFMREEGLFSDITVGNRSVPELFDIDGDGDLDLFMGSLNNHLSFFRNTGTAQQAVFERQSLPIPIHSPKIYSPRFIDLRGEGRFDLLSGSRGGGLFYYRWKP